MNHQQRDNIDLYNSFIKMSSLEKLKYLNSKKTHQLDQFLQARYNQPEDIYGSKPTLSKFKRARSESKLSKSSVMERQKRTETISNMRLYNKLNHQLQQIKETIKDSLASRSHRRPKKQSKYKDKVITEIAEPEPRYKYTRNYNDVLNHIKQIKETSKQHKSTDLKGKVAGGLDQEKTLFYGIDFIDQVEYKIKIKLSKTQYHLFAKNHYTKVMLEMSYGDYMKLHLGDLRGNPCHIFKYLEVRNDRVVLVTRGTNGRCPPSFKSYVGHN